MANQLLKCGDVVLLNLPSHRPKGHEQEGKRPVIIIGVPVGVVRYPVVIVIPLSCSSFKLHILRDEPRARLRSSRKFRYGAA